MIETKNLFILKKVRNLKEKPTKTKKEQKISKIIDNSLSLTVARYLRKNPSLVFKNFKNEKSIFGHYKVSNKIFEKTEENLDSIINSLKKLYNNKQLEKYEN